VWQPVSKTAKPAKTGNVGSTPTPSVYEVIMSDKKVEETPKVIEEKIPEKVAEKFDSTVKAVVNRVVEALTPAPIPMFKLHLYRPNGQVRADISKAVLYELSKNWGDLMKIIPSNRWSTLEEIVQMVWEWEKRQFRKTFTRTRKQIEDGVVALYQAGVLIQK
jgi:hypothetical protein